jgi:hypothetical protein
LVLGAADFQQSGALNALSRLWGLKDFKVPESLSSTRIARVGIKKWHVIS